MTSLKFRLWNAESNEMVYVDFDDLCDGYHACDFRTCYTDAIHKPPVMQFTGLKDKDGVDIYAGDRLKCISEKHTGTVWFEHGGFMMDCCGWGDEPIINLVTDDIKVYGHIYDQKGE